MRYWSSGRVLRQDFQRTCAATRWMAARDWSLKAASPVSHAYRRLGVVRPQAPHRTGANTARHRVRSRTRCDCPSVLLRCWMPSSACQPEPARFRHRTNWRGSGGTSLPPSPDLLRVERVRQLCARQSLDRSLMICVVLPRAATSRERYGAHAGPYRARSPPTRSLRVHGLSCTMEARRSTLQSSLGTNPRLHSLALFFT